MSTTNGILACSLGMLVPFKGYGITSINSTCWYARTRKAIDVADNICAGDICDGIVVWRDTEIGVLALVNLEEIHK